MRDDMLPPVNRSIRNISASPHRRAPIAREHHFEPEPPRPRKRRTFIWLLLGVVVVCAVFGLLLSTLFAGADITVYTRSAEIAVAAPIAAEINPVNGGLAYITMTVTRAATTTVSATGVRDVSRPASGVITIYNNHSTAEQRLITNTRFEAPDGKIYRIHEPATVPGATKNANGALTPGTISVTVYADSPGEEYNRGQTRFTIPGFKGDPRYETFYATTNAITGGFVGSEPAVAQADLTRAERELRDSLERSIYTGITSQLPEGFLPIEKAIEITYTDIAQLPGERNSAILSQSATASVAIVRMTELSSAIAQAYVPEYGGEGVTIGNPTAITLSSASTTRPIGPLTFIVAGVPQVVWQYDPIALKQALLGREKADFESILQTFRPSIVRAEAKVRPFWQRKFPTSPEKITIETKVE